MVFIRFYKLITFALIAKTSNRPPAKRCHWLRMRMRCGYTYILHTVREPYKNISILRQSNGSQKVEARRWEARHLVLSSRADQNELQPQKEEKEKKNNASIKMVSLTEGVLVTHVYVDAIGPFYMNNRSIFGWNTIFQMWLHSADAGDMENISRVTTNGKEKIMRYFQRGENRFANINYIWSPRQVEQQWDMSNVDRRGESCKKVSMNY